MCKSATHGTWGCHIVATFVGYPLRKPRSESRVVRMPSPVPLKRPSGAWSSRHWKRLVSSSWRSSTSHSPERLPVCARASAVPAKTQFENHEKAQVHTRPLASLRVAFEQRSRSKSATVSIRRWSSKGLGSPICCTESRPRRSSGWGRQHPSSGILHGDRSDDSATLRDPSQKRMSFIRRASLIWTGSSPSRFLPASVADDPPQRFS